MSEGESVKKIKWLPLRVLVSGIALFRLCFRIRSAFPIPYFTLIVIFVMGIVSAFGGLSGRLAWANWEGAAEERADCLQHEPLSTCLDRYRYGRAEVGTSLVGRPLKLVSDTFDPDTYDWESLRALPLDAEAAAVLYTHVPDDEWQVAALYSDVDGAPLVRLGGRILSLDTSDIHVVPLGVPFVRLTSLAEEPTRPWDYVLALVSFGALVVFFFTQMSSFGAVRTLRPAPAFYRSLEPMIGGVLFMTVYISIGAGILGGSGQTTAAASLHLLLGCIAVAIALQSVWMRLGLGFQDLDLTWLVNDALPKAAQGPEVGAGYEEASRALTLDDIDLLRALQGEAPWDVLSRYGLRLRDQVIDRVSLGEACRIVWQASAEDDSRADGLVERVLQRAWSSGDCVWPVETIERLRTLQAMNFITVVERSIRLRTPALEALAMPALWYVQDVPFYVRQAIAEADGLLSAGRGAAAVNCCGRMVERFASEFLFGLLPDSMSSQPQDDLYRKLLAPAELKRVSSSDSPGSRQLRADWCSLWHEAATQLVPDDDLRARVDALHTHEPSLVVVALTTRLSAWAEPPKDDVALSDWNRLCAAKVKDRDTLKLLFVAVGAAPRRGVDDAYAHWRTRVRREFSRMDLAARLAILGALFSDNRLGSAANALSRDVALEVYDEDRRRDGASASSVEHAAQAVRTLRNDYAHARTGRPPAVSVRDAYHMVWLSRVFVSMCVQRSRPELGEP